MHGEKGGAFSRESQLGLYFSHKHPGNTVSAVMGTGDVMTTQMMTGSTFLCHFSIFFCFV